MPLYEKEYKDITFTHRADVLTQSRCVKCGRLLSVCGVGTPTGVRACEGRAPIEPKQAALRCAR